MALAPHASASSQEDLLNTLLIGGVFPMVNFSSLCVGLPICCLALDSMILPLPVINFLHSLQKGLLSFLISESSSCRTSCKTSA